MVSDRANPLKATSNFDDFQHPKTDSSQRAPVKRMGNRFSDPSDNHESGDGQRRAFEVASKLSGANHRTTGHRDSQNAADDFFA